LGIPQITKNIDKQEQEVINKVLDMPILLE
jgi:hypothetical protein